MNSTLLHLLIIYIYTPERCLLSIDIGSLRFLWNQFLSFDDNKQTKTLIIPVQGFIEVVKLLLMMRIFIEAVKYSQRTLSTQEKRSRPSNLDSGSE